MSNTVICSIQLNHSSLPLDVCTVYGPYDYTLQREQVKTEPIHPKRCALQSWVARGNQPYTSTSGGS